MPALPAITIAPDRETSGISSKKVAALTAMIMAGGSSGAFAATTATEDGSIYDLPELEIQAQRNRAVTSPKFTAPLVDTPQSISVIPDQVFLQQGAQNLTEVLRNSPGITFNAGENGFASGMSNFSLRGFDTTGSIFIDGARDSGNYFRDIFNVEQVEVAKGPAGDNGRGGAGGYVNLATKSARLGAFTHLSASHGVDEHTANGRTRVAADINTPLSDGTAFRLNALWQDSGVPGRKVAENNAWGVAPSLAFGLDGPTRLLLSYQHTEQEDVPDWGVPGALISGMISHDPAARGEANRSRFYGHATDYDNVNADALLARVEHDLSPTLRLSNQTRWSDTEREALYTVPFNYAPASRLVTTQRQAFRRDNTALSNLTNLAASFESGPLQHALSAGLEVTREESTADRFPSNGALGNPGDVSVDAPDPFRPLAGFVGLVPTQSSAVEIKTLAAYVYDTVQINPRWQATGGLRVESYEVDITSDTAAGAPQGPDGFDRNDTTVSGKLGLVFKPAANGSLYAAFGVATLPPGSFLSNPDISREGDNAFPGWSAGQNSAGSKVQRSINYELGAKWELFERRLTASAAFFRTERENIAMAGTVNTVPGTFAGYAEQIIQGLELGAAGRISSGWQVFGGILFMDSERRHDPAIDAARLAANPGDYGAATTTNGDELAFTPRVSASLWTTYRLPIGLTFGGGLQYSGDSYLGRPDNAERIIANGNAGELPGHTVFNAMVSYEVNRHLTLRLNIDNLTDEFYAASANWNARRVITGPSRSFLLSADLRF